MGHHLRMRYYLIHSKKGSFKMTLTVWILVLTLVQLIWFVAVWRKSGFLAALGLAFYGVLSGTVVILSYARDGVLLP